MAKKTVVKRFDPKNLPEIIFVGLEREGNGSYLCAWREMDGIDAGTIVGIYELTRTGKVVITTELVEIS